jgi:hypothetical protein
LEPSINLFLSWILVGCWVSISIKTIAKIRSYKEFNSPHNTSFFILGINSIGLFYFYSSFYTELSNWEAFQEIQNYTFINPWIVFFALPYLIYGFYSLYKCIKKYRVVYIYKNKSVNARRFVIFYLILIFIDNIIFLILLIYRVEIVFFTPINNFPGFIFIFHTSFIFVLLIYGIAKKKTSISDLSPEQIAERRAQIESIQRARIRPRERPSSTRSSSRKTTPSRRSSPSQTTSRRSSSKSSVKRDSRTKPSRKKESKKKKRKLTPQQKKQLLERIKSMKPKTGMLTLDDFKCIFCFNIPKYPEDKGRKIVLCPKCNYPAHADEFKEWAKDSDLCSRCSAELPSSYKRNPKTVSVKFYTKVIQYYRKKQGF